MSAPFSLRAMAVAHNHLAAVVFNPRGSESNVVLVPLHVSDSDSVSQHHAVLGLVPWSFGIRPMPDTFELDPDTFPMRPLKFRETHEFYLPHYKRQSHGSLYATRSIATSGAEVIVLFPELGEVIFMHAPLEALDVSVTTASTYFPFYIRLPQPLSSDLPWGGRILDPEQDDRRTVCGYPFPGRRPALHPGPVSVTVAQAFSSCAPHVATPWRVTSASRKLAVGQLATLWKADSGNYFTQVKLIKIRAVERGWVEFSAQVAPARVPAVGRQFLHLRVPLTEVVMPFQFLWWYAFHSQTLPCVLARVHPVSSYWQEILHLLCC